jgi:hypothetical protein
MVVDMRSYHPDIAPNVTGNYQAEIIYNTPCDVETPVLIRESLTRPNGILKRVKDDQELPGAKILSGGLSLKNLTSAPGNSIVNDWSSYYEIVTLRQNDEVQLKPELHFPMFITSWYDQFNRWEYFIRLSLVGGQAGVTGHSTTVCNRGRGCTRRSTKSHVVDMLCIVQSVNVLLFRSYYKTCKRCTVAYVFNFKQRQHKLL